MKIAFLGAGALGCAIGSALTEGGHETWLVDRFAEHVEAMSRDGLQVDDERGTRRVKVRATIDPAEVGAVDLVIVLVKSFHTDSAMRGALDLVGPGTVVLSLQNGLGHEDVLSEIVGRERVLAGKTYVGGVLRAPGHIQSGVTGKLTIIGELDGQITSRAKAIADAFNSAGLSTTVSDNIVGTMWDKLLINVATGAITGITGLTYGQLYDEPVLKATSLAAIEEAMATAKAAGVTLSMRLRRTRGRWQQRACRPHSRPRCCRAWRSHRSRRSTLSTEQWCVGASASAWPRPSTRRSSLASKASSAR